MGFQLILFDLIGKGQLTVRWHCTSICFQLILFDLIGKDKDKVSEKLHFLLKFPTNPI